MFVSLLHFLSLMWVVHATLLEALPTDQSGPQCVNWGVYAREAVRVYEGEAGRIHCPLFSYPKLYNYAQIQSTGHTLLWYKHTHELEEPVDLSLPTYVKHKDALWIQPASMKDGGEYVCILRNMSSCVKIGVRLDVVPRKGDCDYTLHRNFSVPIMSNFTLRCPNVQHLPTKKHSIIWYHNCSSNFLDFTFREADGDTVVINQMFTHYRGPYTCVVTYQSNGHTLNYTHTINLRAVSNEGAKEPKILNPANREIYNIRVGKNAKFSCRAFLPYLSDEEPHVWWSVNNKTLEELSESRYTSPEFRVVEDDYGDRTVERMLNVSPFKEEDLHKEFRCSVHNSKGFDSRAATLKEEVYVPSVELGCGLGVTLVLALLLFVLYRVFWLEVHLLYRSWFGTDERDTDNKEYDVYISYARNTEEEEFVMETLRRVLEVEFGYTVCIFDRDSLPGGTVTEETLQFVSRSRRLLVILSACSAFRDAQALLEVRAGVSAMLRGGSVKLVLIHYKSTRMSRDKSHKQNTHKCVKELRRARIALALVQWEGEKSTSLSSHFWKKLQLQLPVCTSTHATKRTTQDTSCNGDKRSSERNVLMLEELRTPNTQPHNHTTHTVDTDVLHKT
ncbi:interleukin-1 receptor accessory protein [Tachysurus fulvidraco]|uniref:interleukin-1 receptor accessory protein n=1 Tax=Tachysurus fulvidraco TaxID=1234273 RepID=UPI001FEDCA5B|nr:interleukin-1 receptor accessory protein [Tachysurus fulvidraco]